MLRRMMMAASSGGGPMGDLVGEIMADSPWGYWKLDESPSDAATYGAQDSSGNGRHLTVFNGSPTFGVDELFPGGGTAMRVVKTGAGNKVGSGNNTYGAAVETAFNGNKALTICAVVKLASLGGALVHVGNYQLSGSQGFWMSTDANGALALGAFTEASWSAVLSSNGAVSAGVPAIMHVVRAVGGGVSIYKNGALIATGTIGSPRAQAGTGSGGMRVGVGGANSSTNVADGTSADIQHAAVFASALSPERVLAHAQAAGFA